MAKAKGIALVSGAAQGIGYSCAKALHADGVFVVLTDVKQDLVVKAANTIGTDAVGFCVDMSDLSAVVDLFAMIEKDLRG